MSFVIQNQRMRGWLMPWGSGWLLLPAGWLLFLLKQRNWSPPKWKDSPVVSQPTDSEHFSITKLGIPTYLSICRGTWRQRVRMVCRRIFNWFRPGGKWLGQEMDLKHIFKLIFIMLVFIKPGWIILSFYFT